MLACRRLVLEEGHHELRAAKAARFAAWLSAHPQYGQLQGRRAPSCGASLRQASGHQSPFRGPPAPPGGAAALTPELRHPVLATLAALAGCNIAEDGEVLGRQLSRSLSQPLYLAAPNVVEHHFYANMTQCGYHREPTLF